MKKMKRSEFRDLPKTRLHLEEFWEIAQLFKESCKSVEATIDRFRLEDNSEAEIQNLRESLRTPRVYGLGIHGSEPTVHLDICSDWKLGPQRRGIFLLDADDSTSLGLAKKVTKALPRRRLADFLGWKAYLSGLAATVSVPLLIHYAAWARHGIGPAALLALFLFALALQIISLLFRIRPGPVLYLERHSERKSFLTAHGHELLKGAILLMLGSVLTVAVQLILRWLR